MVWKKAKRSAPYYVDGYTDGDSLPVFCPDCGEGDCHLIGANVKIDGHYQLMRPGLYLHFHCVPCAHGFDLEFRSTPDGTVVSAMYYAEEEADDGEQV